MSKKQRDPSPVVRDCSVCRPFPVFDDQGKEILPCGNNHCETTAGKPFYPKSRDCLNASCSRCGKFHSRCPAVLYHDEECFLATNTLQEWEAAALPTSESPAETVGYHAKERAKARRNARLNTPEGKLIKKGYNAQNYINRKASGVYQEARDRRRVQRQAERAAKALLKETPAGE